MSTAELAAQKRLTQAFINMDPTTITLYPQVEEITPNGGRKKVRGVPRSPQVFKVIPMTFDQRPTITAGGRERIIDYQLMGTVESVVEVNDVWSADGFTTEFFLVVAVSDGHQYERKVLCERHLWRDGLQAVV